MLFEQPLFYTTFLTTEI